MRPDNLPRQSDRDEPSERLPDPSGAQETACLDRNEIARLQEHSRMLGQIANLVEHYCLEGDTTLDGVKALNEDRIDEQRWANHYCRKLMDAKRLGYLPDDFQF
jgi:hypothetical protein